MVWIVIALMTGAAVLCVVWPLSKPQRASALSGAGDLRFYQTQLRSIDREIAAGEILPADAAASRAEVGRRLIAAAERGAQRGTGLGRTHLFLLAVLVIVAVPLVSLPLYLKVGAPETPDLPLASRQFDPAHDNIQVAIERVESHLVAHPEDGKGWDILAPLYMRFARYDDAVRAYDRALALQGESTARRTGYGQALMLQAGGVVTSEARSAFVKALADDPAAPQPQFFLALAAEQDGDKAMARALYADLLAKAPADAPWRSMVEAKRAALDGGTGPTTPFSNAPQAATIAALPADQRADMIHNMVDGLAARLAQNGQDRDGWLKLVRAYVVLGEKSKAVNALADARRNLAADPQGLDQLAGLARELGLES